MSNNGAPNPVTPHKTNADEDRPAPESFKKPARGGDIDKFRRFSVQASYVSQQRSAKGEEVRHLNQEINTLEDEKHNYLPLWKRGIEVVEVIEGEADAKILAGKMEKEDVIAVATASKETNCADAIATRDAIVRKAQAECQAILSDESKTLNKITTEAESKFFDLQTAVTGSKETAVNEALLRILPHGPVHVYHPEGVLAYHSKYLAHLDTTLAEKEASLTLKSKELQRLKQGEANARKITEKIHSGEPLDSVDFEIFPRAAPTKVPAVPTSSNVGAGVSLFMNAPTKTVDLTNDDASATSIDWGDATVQQCLDYALEFFRGRLYQGKPRLKNLELNSVLDTAWLVWGDIHAFNQHATALGMHANPNVIKLHSSLSALDGCYDKKYIQDSFSCKRGSKEKAGMSRMRLALQLGLEAPPGLSLEDCFARIQGKGKIAGPPSP